MVPVVRRVEPGATVSAAREGIPAATPFSDPDGYAALWRASDCVRKATLIGDRVFSGRAEGRDGRSEAGADADGQRRDSRVQRRAVSSPGDWQRAGAELRRHGTDRRGF